MVEGTVRIVGPADVPDGFTMDRLPQTLCDVFTPPAGPPDWAEFDQVMAAERHATVLMEPAHLASNPHRAAAYPRHVAPTRHRRRTERCALTAAAAGGRPRLYTTVTN